ncbi:MAG TPA: HD domain-containing protein, partial [Tepidisphaeraceae bacterium]|nr:HD domain-containing protein [Tepidisphaeraceae bacterium]
MPEKILRDPVHDVISLRLEDPADRIVFHLLGTPELQRLRRIRQLGMASLAYPGADHSRYSHSIGVFETARQILDRLAHETDIPEHRRTACLCAALLHDVGHGPLSHVFERVSGVHHEAVTHRLILDPLSGVNQVLRHHDPALPQQIVNLLRASPTRDFLCDVLSSQLDADRLDYLLRDNLMTGSNYGDYDLRWLLSAMTVDPATRRLAVTHKGVSAVEAYLQARHHMYRNVYFHKVVRSAEGMVKLALQRARRLAVQGRLPGSELGDVANKALLGQQLSIEQFIELDDITILHCFKHWSRSDDPMLATLSRGLLFRKLFKTIDLSRTPDTRAVADAVAAVFAHIEQVGGDPHYEMFFDEPADTPYKTDAADQLEAAKQILVREPDGLLTDFAAASPFTQALARQ